MTAFVDFHTDDPSLRVTFYGQTEEPSMTATPPMVERVARAMASANGADPDFTVPGKASEPRWRLFVEEARLGIAAMREPTKEMLRQAVASMTDEDNTLVWRDMVDAALK